MIEFFRVIQRNSDSLAEKYLSMFALTNRGKDISPFEVSTINVKKKKLVDLTGFLYCRTKLARYIQSG